MATHDYIISNASGAAVRSDLNNALAAIVSNNSNATEPATTYAYQWWADIGSSPAVMKLRNAANDGWITLFQLDGEWSTIALEDGTAAAPSLYFKDSGTDTGFFSSGTDEVAISTGGVQRATVDSSGRLLVGTSSSSAQISALFQGNSGGSTSWGALHLARGTTSPSSGQSLGELSFSDSGHDIAGLIACQRDGGTWTSSTSQPTRLSFFTTNNGSSAPTERMRISNGGTVTIGQASGGSTSADGHYFAASGQAYHGQTSSTALILNRRITDGDVVSIRAQDVQEGSISVSGTTVSYNGAHLARWSQLPGGVERTEILRGSVLSNIDEMCEWGDEDNEQLNRMKVSDVEGDKNVSGVFQAWDDDDDTYTNDFYCAMTGDFVIRIGAGVTVERGDLLMSAGDGTAKPQDDDIIRSKTIAKVTSTNVSCTYDDGSYCVPCVLMAC